MTICVADYTRCCTSPRSALSTARRTSQYSSRSSASSFARRVRGRRALTPGLPASAYHSSHPENVTHLLPYQVKRLIESCGKLSKMAGLIERFSARSMFALVVFLALGSLRATKSTTARNARSALMEVPTALRGRMLPLKRLSGSNLIALITAIIVLSCQESWAGRCSHNTVLGPSGSSAAVLG
jgi:hypothetical protein